MIETGDCGYPTEEDLQFIREYKYSPDPEELLSFLESLWHWPSYIIRIEKEKKIYLELHTGGWSGNESIIDALSNTMFWHIYWQKSERGGHYYFTIPLYNKEA